MSSSFSEMRGADRVSVQVSILRASIFEWIDPDHLERDSHDFSVVLLGAIDSFNLCREYDNEMKVPDKPVKVAAIRATIDDLCNFESKFPLGFAVFGKEETYFRVGFHTELLEKIANAVPAATDGSISFTFEIPHHEKYESEMYYPILAYGAHISNGAPNKSTQPTR